MIVTRDTGGLTMCNKICIALALLLALNSAATASPKHQPGASGSVPTSIHNCTRATWGGRGLHCDGAG